MRGRRVLDKIKHSQVAKRTAVAAGFVVVCALLYCLVSAAIYQVKLSVEAQYTDSGTSLARVYSLIFENMLNQAQDELRMYASATGKGLLAHSMPIPADVETGDEANIADYMVSHREWRPQIFLYMFFVDTQGTLWNDSGRVTDVRDRQYYKEIAEEGRDVSIGRAVISRTTGENVVHIACALRNKDGALRGIIGGVVTVEYIERLFADTMPSRDLRPFVSDSSMKCVLHPNGTPDTVIDMHGDKGDGAVHIYTSNEHGKDASRFFIKKIKDASWYVGVSIAESRLYATYNGLNCAKWIVFAVASAAAVVMYIASLVSLKRLGQLQQEEAENDSVTGLLTQAAFEKKAQAMLDAMDDAGGEFALVQMDISGFKFINKTYGADAGNETLREAARIVSERLREYGGLMARGYADHFYYFVRMTVSSDVFMEKFKAAIADIEQKAQEAAHQFTPRYGVAFAAILGGGLSSNRKSVLQLIGEASTARKIVKTTPDKNYGVYSAELERKVLHEQQVERNMKKALERGEFFAVYQPKMSLKTDKIIGAEALVRWNSPEMGLLSPNDFIPVFERNGFIKQLDFEVYEMAFSLIRRLLDEGHKVVPISLNMSRTHDDAGAFIKEFMRRFQKYNISPDLVEVEILERSVGSEKPILQEVTDELRRLGFSVSMDDFGSGESSLNMLNNIAVDTLKFDQNFLRSNQDSEKLREFITSLVQMAQKMQRKTLFEGVETKEQRDFLKSINCDSVQGYFYSKPLKEEDFIAFMEQHS